VPVTTTTTTEPKGTEDSGADLQKKRKKSAYTWHKEMALCPEFKRIAHDYVTNTDPDTDASNHADAGGTKLALKLRHAQAVRVSSVWEVVQPQSTSLASTTATATATMTSLKGVAYTECFQGF
jgi:hypothetical protein